MTQFEGVRLKTFKIQSNMDHSIEYEYHLIFLVFSNENHAFSIFLNKNHVFSIFLNENHGTTTFNEIFSKIII